QTWPVRSKSPGRSKIIDRAIESDENPKNELWPPCDGLHDVSHGSPHRLVRQGAQQPADQRDGPLQYPLRVLHARKPRVSAAESALELRGDRAVRADRGAAGNRQDSPDGR